MKSGFEQKFLLAASGGFSVVPVVSTIRAVIVGGLSNFAAYAFAHAILVLDTFNTIVVSAVYYVIHQKGEENNTTSWACETGVPLGANATKMHWRGTPGAGSSMPVLKPREDSQSIYMGVARQYNFSENNNKGH
ncbi:hypothetical protein AHAS_Ahas10G0146500 [Arachis hypogaea]